MSTGTGGAGEAEPGAGEVEPAARRLPAEFTREIRVALRYEAGVAVKAGVVLAVLAVIVVLRALYLA